MSFCKRILRLGLRILIVITKYILWSFTKIEEVLPNNASGNATTLSCGNWDEDTEYKVNMCSYWMEGVLLTSTGTIGLIGNVFSIVILSKPEMYNAFNQLLIALSTLDSIFIFLAIIDSSLTR